MYIVVKINVNFENSNLSHFYQWYIIFNFIIFILMISSVKNEEFLNFLFSIKYFNHIIQLYHHILYIIIYYIIYIIYYHIYSIIYYISQYPYLLIHNYFCFLITTNLFFSNNAWEKTIWRLFYKKKHLLFAYALKFTRKFLNYRFIFQVSVNTRVIFLNILISSNKVHWQHKRET